MDWTDFTSVWATETAPAAFATSPLYEAFVKGLKSLGDTAGLEIVRLTSPEANLLAALNAPCTEVFTAHGAEPAYPAAVGAFADKVAAQPPEGYRGGAVLDSVDEVQGLGRVVKLVIGWDSREVHLAAKGKPGREFILLSFRHVCGSCCVPFAWLPVSGIWADVAV